MINRGTVVDMFQGLPEPKVLDEFFKTAEVVDSMKHDQTVIEALLQQVQELIAEEKFDMAEKAIDEGLAYEKWKDQFGA